MQTHGLPYAHPLLILCAHVNYEQAPASIDYAYHTLGVNLEGIAWLAEFHGDDLLNVIKQRRVRELESMDPADPVTALPAAFGVAASPN